MNLNISQHCSVTVYSFKSQKLIFIEYQKIIKIIKKIIYYKTYH